MTNDIIGVLMLRMFSFISKIKNNFLYRCLTMYQNEATNKFSREIALENVVLQINTNQDKSHYFELRTEQNIYYCGCKRTRSRVK
jgi:hypothetical protein